MVLLCTLVSLGVVPVCRMDFGMRLSRRRVCRMAIGSLRLRFRLRKKLLQAIYQLLKLCIPHKKLLDLGAEVGTFFARLPVSKHIICILHVMSPRADHNIDSD